MEPVDHFNVVEHFDAGYTDVDIYNVPLYLSVPDRRIREYLIEVAKSAHTILDAGCGMGQGLLQFQKITNAQLIGIDSSSVATAKARRLLGERVWILTGTLENKWSDMMDLVYCSGVIEHLEDDIQFIAQAGRTIRAGGFFCLTTASKKPWAWYFYRNREGQTVIEPTHLREYLSPGPLVNGLVNNGFAVLHVAESPLRYPLIDPVLKFITKRFKQRWVTAAINSNVVLALRRSTMIRIPGYYTLQILARKGGYEQELYASVHV